MDISYWYKEIDLDGDCGKLSELRLEIIIIDGVDYIKVPRHPTYVMSMGSVFFKLGKKNVLTPLRVKNYGVDGYAFEMDNKNYNLIDFTFWMNIYLTTAGKHLNHITMTEEGKITYKGSAG